MMVCDKCRDVTRPAGEFKVALVKLLPGEQRASRSEVKAGTVELCDACVDPVWAALVRALPNAPAHGGANPRSDDD